MKRIIFKPTLLRTSLLLAMGSAIYAPAFATAADQNQPSADRGAMDDDRQVFNHSTSNNQEQQFVNQTYTLWGLEDEFATEAETRPAKDTDQQTSEVRADSLRFSFASGLALVKAENRNAFEALVEKLKSQNIERIELVGHTDNQPLSKNAKRHFNDNYDLGLHRAKAVGELLKAHLSLSDEHVVIDSAGATQPIASNATSQGMAQNRRVTFTVWSRPNRAPLKTIPCEYEPTQPTPFQISVDGQPLSSSSAGSADQQRCQDMRLAENDIQLQYDSRNLDKRLNISANSRQIAEGNTVQFQGYSNYLFWVDRAEARVLDQHGNLVATVPLNKQLQGVWVNNLNSTSHIYYQLRVYDQQNHFDETEMLPLWVNKQPTAENSREARLAGYGENRLIKQSIPVKGGAVTVNVKSLENQTLHVFGLPVPVDQQGKAVTQQILPEGHHRVEVVIATEHEENRQHYYRHLELANDDWFFVGLADLTLGRNNTTSAAELLNPDNHHYEDGKTYLDGRLAFYAKGPFQDQYTVTASVDTGEDELKNLLSNIDEKNPRALLRRLDTKRHWPTFGDGSSLKEDAPTQGKLYVKVEDERSHILWGNFKETDKSTELAQVDRALYGANLRYNSEENTEHHATKTKVRAFVAEPGTLSAREDYRGTGGSVYFLRHQDITSGSERVSIEIRDQDSGEVLSNTPLDAGNDYDMDAIQGRILLSAPLSSNATNSALVQAGSLSGNPAYLVVTYEYTPDNTDLSDMATYGRVSHWVNDNIQVGLTLSRQDQDGEMQHLNGFDFTYLETEDTGFSIETANTDGEGFSEFGSDDGGFNFDEVSQSGGAAAAYRVDAHFSMADLTDDDSTTGKGHFYIESRQDGFSAPGKLTDTDTLKTGAGYITDINDVSQLEFDYDDIQADDSDDKQVVEINYHRKLDEEWKLGIGLRHDRQTGPNVDEGTRDDVAVRLTHNDSPEESTWGFVQGSINRDSGRELNNRIGVGTEQQITEKAKLTGEISTGNQGMGAQAGVNYQWSDRTSFYTNYSLDSDDLENGERSRNGQLVSGVRSKMTDEVSVYAEGRLQTGDQPGLLQAYGVDYSPSEQWHYGASLEYGEINQETDSEIERIAVTGSMSYKGDGHRYAGSLEFREDDSKTEKRKTWLMRNNYSSDIDDNWKAIAHFDFSLSDSSLGDIYDGEYVEGALGYAYRPVDNDELNLLFKYTYLYDLAASEQLTPSESGTVDYAQRSHVLAVDATYDITPKCAIGGKYAYRLGELRYSRDDSADWFSSHGQLLIARADLHVVKEWDATLEWRLRKESAADDSRSGFLAAIYRHMNENVKLGVGFNASEFNDDVTDLDYDARGWFINLVGKY